MHYHFGDWVIDSALRLPELQVAQNPPQRMDFSLCLDSEPRRPDRPRRWLRHWSDANGRRVLSLARMRDGILLLRFPDALHVRVDISARRANLRILDDSAPEMIAHLVVDQLLPRIRACLDGRPLHAAAVRIRQGAILMAGESGWGKSTLAGALQQQGFAILSDDCVLLRLLANKARARATYRSLRLLPDSLARIDHDPQRLTLMSEGSAKRRLRLDQGESASEEHVIVGLFVLTAPVVGTTHIAITPLSPSQICIEIMKHTLQLDLCGRAQHATYLRETSALAQRISAFALEFPRDYASLAEVTKRMLACIDVSYKLSSDSREQTG